MKSLYLCNPPLDDNHVFAEWGFLFDVDLMALLANQRTRFRIMKVLKYKVWRGIFYLMKKHAWKHSSKSSHDNMPSPNKPSGHSHLTLPIRLVQIADSWHTVIGCSNFRSVSLYFSSVVNAHSSMSIHSLVATSLWYPAGQTHGPFWGYMTKS